jgi:hypothetical protein
MRSTQSHFNLRFFLQGLLHFLVTGNPSTAASEEIGLAISTAKSKAVAVENTIIPRLMSAVAEAIRTETGSHKIPAIHFLTMVVRQEILERPLFLSQRSFARESPIHLVCSIRTHAVGHAPVSASMEASAWLLQVTLVVSSAFKFVNQETFSTIRLAAVAAQIQISAVTPQPPLIPFRVQPVLIVRMFAIRESTSTIRLQVIVLQETEHLGCRLQVNPIAMFARRIVQAHLFSSLTMFTSLNAVGAHYRAQVDVLVRSNRASLRAHLAVLVFVQVVNSRVLTIPVVVAHQGDVALKKYALRRAPAVRRQGVMNASVIRH